MALTTTCNLWLIRCCHRVGPPICHSSSTPSRRTATPSIQLLIRHDLSNLMQTFHISLGPQCTRSQCCCASRNESFLRDNSTTLQDGIGHIRHGCHPSLKLKT
ncbi:hypothetical protein CEXT_749451 [Caerostris extrusa]|uniref:Secreted protein n=1 Tax=Caerostris extrusa TaxID=172846 RepID=A0AAV4R8M6_CAEEX|nr:hypothetical protein CEXT_749451 [Caerostris extrusa]